MKKLAIIADDLTGAMDAGVQLKKMGYKVCVAIGTKRIKELVAKTDVMVFDTESRNISPESAYQKVKAVVRFIKKHDLRLIYKKVDSSLRGNIGREIKAVLDFTDIKLIIIAPALPYNGRTTINGYHYINGIMLTKTEIASDCLAPVRSSYIPDIINSEQDAMATVVGIDSIKEGKEKIISEIKNAYHSGFNAMVADAERESHLKTIAEASRSCNIKTLLCGSAGLIENADNMLNKILPVKKNGEKRILNEQIKTKTADFVVVISGSLSKITDIQIKQARKSKKTGTIILNTHIYFFSAEGRRREADRIEQKIQTFISNNKNIIIGVSRERTTKKPVCCKRDKNSFAKNSAILQKVLIRLLLKIISIKMPSGMIIIGGDTLLNICKGLDARGIEIKHELEPYIPAGDLKGGVNAIICPLLQRREALGMSIR